MKTKKRSGWFSAKNQPIEYYRKKRQSTLEKLPRVGDRLGGWTVLSQPVPEGRHWYARLRCDCGDIHIREISLIQSRARLGLNPVCIKCRHTSKMLPNPVGRYVRNKYKRISPWMTTPQAEFLANYRAMNARCHKKVL